MRKHSAENVSAQPTRRSQKKKKTKKKEAKSYIQIQK